jgi:hypothetical protein
MRVVAATKTVGIVQASSVSGVDSRFSTGRYLRDRSKLVLDITASTD